MLRKILVAPALALVLAGMGTVNAMAQCAGNAEDASHASMNHGNTMTHEGATGDGMMMPGKGKGGCSSMGMGMSDHGPTFVEGRIAFFKAELAVTDAQKDVWNAFAEAMRRNFDNAKSTHETMSKAMHDKAPFERLETRIASMEGRVKALRDVKTAYAALFQALSPDQREKVDQILGALGCMAGLGNMGSMSGMSGGMGCMK